MVTVMIVAITIAIVKLNESLAVGVALKQSAKVWACVRVARAPFTIARMVVDVQIDEPSCNSRGHSVFQRSPYLPIRWRRLAYGNTSTKTKQASVTTRVAWSVHTDIVLSRHKNARHKTVSSMHRAVTTMTSERSVEPGNAQQRTC